MLRTAFILVVGCLMAGLQGKAQMVTISVREAKLESVLKIFKKQTGYSFFVDEPTLKKAERVTLNLKGVPFADALEQCFSLQPKLIYSMVGQTVVISEKTNVDTDAGANRLAEEEDFIISGNVYNRRGEPLFNASVLLKGSSKGTTTDSYGKFKLQGTRSGNVVRVSFIGYKTMELSVASPGKPLHIVLDDASDELDEVVAQGYSKTTKRLSTSSVAKVGGDEIARQPVMDPLLALQGKVPGMVLTPYATQEGSPVVINIRGRGLLSDASANPLVVIDGIPLNVGSNKGVAFGDGPVQGLMALMSPAGSQSMLFGLNPRDIESIEILKDIGATAIYGSLGANGVILITTKRGKAGAPNLNVNVNSGISKVLKYYDLLNTPQYLEMRREALRNDGLVPSVINAPELTLWDTTRYTDWQREFFGRTAATLNATVSYSGGTPLFTHNISANYSRSGNITRVSGKSETMGVNIALDRKSENRKFNTALTVNYTNSFLDMVNAPGVANLPPNAPPIFDSSGNLNYKDWGGTGFESVLDGFGAMLRNFESRTSSLLAGLKLSYQLANGLNLLTNITYRTSNNTGWNLIPISSQNPGSNPSGSSSLTKSETRGWALEPQIVYDTRLLAKGNLSVTAGATIRSDMSESTSSRALGFTSDALLRSLANAPIVLTDYYRSPYKYAGIMARIEYIWDNKYVVNGIWRRDGSSRFGPGSRFGNFGSVGVAWVASDETWVKNALSPVVKFLKFNANIGTAGTDGGGDYQYLSNWSRGQLALYDEVVPMKSIHAVNQDYQWQLTKELNAGMQLNFAGWGKLQLELNYYRRRVGNQLVNNPTPVFTGFPTVFGNWNALVQNAGWELNLRAVFIQKKDFNWSGSVNAGFNKNRLLEYPQIERTPHYSMYLVGQTLSTRYLLNYLGVDPMTGAYQYEDYNKDGVINHTSVLPPLTYPSDKQVAVDIMPVVQGGISQSFTYKSLSLFLGFDYVIQKGRNAFSSVSGPGRFGNIPVEIFNNRWRNPGDNARYGRLTTGTAQNFQKGVSTLFYGDASFLRFSNVAFSYQLPETLARKIGMKNCSFNINTRNLFSITKYEGVDPEIQNFSAMPPARTITVGINANF
ncbi:SusC/RagA family TonB-linked outer membrane protein [Pseudoflavitalea rhizosphaerae]|uniref:SusC/RagA family TonB-linked outer membrane protein n=1 Tax=Pseudoflavitalea rhizosphaerae TaxID=1884793 RepID=UPI000F8F1599|nr:SusC/RagA family TonB-linked outer membrane protein [Pseudoflavitalea rhizosphaerae]